MLGSILRKALAISISLPTCPNPNEPLMKRTFFLSILPISLQTLVYKLWVFNINISSDLDSAMELGMGF
jgi:hypothetical protein